MTIELAKNKISFIRVLSAGLPDCLTKDYIREACDQAIAALPDHPMTEDQILKIMYDGIPKHWQSPTALSCMKHGMIALIRANVLFVEEK